MSKLEKILISLNLILYGFVVVFSYAYVDLNLTLSQNAISIKIIEALQKLGYFHRTQATIIYILFIFISFSFFIYNLVLIKKGRVGLKYLKIATILNTIILIFSYPFLSSDLFNYLFDAKIIAKYHANPYTNRPLDFANDEWLRFMRWIHRYSPYGPLWLLYSVIPYTLGLGKFLITLFSFKFFIGTFHLLNTYLIYKILNKVNQKQALLGTGFYSLNPLFLLEGIANAHNDIILTTTLLAAIYFYVFNKKAFSIIVLTAGSLIKYIPVLVLPWFFISLITKKRLNFKELVILNLLTMAAFTFIFSTFKVIVPFVSAGATQVQFQPWYLFWTIPFVSLIPNFSLILLSISISIGASLRYLPFLFYGDWSNPMTIIFLKFITITPLVIALLIVLFKLALKRIK